MKTFGLFRATETTPFITIEECESKQDALKEFAINFLPNTDLKDAIKFLEPFVREI